MRRNHFILALIVLAVSLSLVACGSGENSANELPNILENKDVLNELTNSVVMLECYDATGNLYSTGSGFVAFQDNVVVTNYHVIEEEVMSITVQTENGESFEAPRILICDEDLDLAILELDQNSGLTPLEFGNSSELAKGEMIVAIGSPLGLINSVSDGIVSGFLDDELNTIQFTASISHGSSGGALFTKSGKVAGVTYASFEGGQNLNLAIPSDIVVELWESKTESNQMTVEEFYNTFPHIMSVEDVINNRVAVNGQVLKVRGIISSVEVLTLGTLEAKEVKFFLVNSQSEVLGSTIVIDDWSTASTEEKRLSEYEEERHGNRECLSVIVDESLLLGIPLEPGAEIVVQGKVTHFDFYSDVTGYEDDVTIFATKYVDY